VLQKSQSSLQVSFTLPSSAFSVRKIIGHMPVQETTSSHYIKLIPALLIMGLTEEEKTYGTPLSLQGMKDSFRKGIVSNFRTVAMHVS